MSHATATPDSTRTAGSSALLIDRILDRVREELDERMRRQEILTEDLAEQISNLSTLGAFASTATTPVPFSGGTP